MDYNFMLEEINALCDNYDFFTVNCIGESILGRGIHMITLGEGKRQIVYIGGQSGCDFQISFALIRFIKEYCVSLKSGSRLYGLPIDYINKKTSILVIPMLNPDGIEYSIHGVASDNPIRERLLKMNGGSEDFSSWHANARGVDLRRNYNCGFSEYKARFAELGNGAPVGYCGETSESEPETGALCNFLRYSRDTNAVISLCGEGSGVDYVSSIKSDRGARAIADMLDCRLKPRKGDECALYSWCNRELSLPCFSVGCEVKDTDTKAFILYARLRRMLFCAPMLF